MPPFANDDQALGAVPNLPNANGATKLSGANAESKSADGIMMNDARTTPQINLAHSLYSTLAHP